jgi:Fur family ferric uptake transcriptional regulator
VSLEGYRPHEHAHQNANRRFAKEGILEFLSMNIEQSLGAKALRRAGYKLTGPRLTILELMERSGGHLTSAELLTQVEERDPSIGRASVFRTLDLMIKLGIICTSVQGGSTIHYMLMPNGHHHHIICTRCNTLIEFEDCRLSTLIASLEAQYHVHVEGHLLELYGLCGKCQTAFPVPSHEE